MPRTLPTDHVESIVLNGVTFRRYPKSKHATHRRYYTPGGSDAAGGVEALHREIWKQHFGPISSGFQIHHIDGDTLNNSIENLECISGDEHKRIHAAEGTWRNSTAVHKHMAEIRDLAAAWHSTKEGREWHANQARESWSSRIPMDFTCSECGVGFTSKKIGSQRQDGKRFCSGKCRATVKRKEGRDRKQKHCVECGIQFLGLSRAQTCSRKCGARLRSRNMRSSL
ncbi:HNH endonuclease signature motif containing protein [Xanthobacter sp. ZOL 2024]